MRKLKLFPYFAIILLLASSCLFASNSDEGRKLKNKIYNFSSKNIDVNMITKWKLSGLYLEKYDDNYTFIKNPKLRILNSRLITNISSETAIDPTGKMDEIYLKRNVFINRNDSLDNNTVKLYTSYAIFYLSRDLVETDRDVTIITSDSTTTGNGLSADLNKGLITILSDAKRMVKEDNKIQIIKGNQMVYNTKTDEWTVKNKPANDLKKSIKNKVTTTFNLE
tara:strand:+ start:2591 stop:3259 length:669 start_codon:yes stop_codon:yes gene_type:complete